MKGKTKVGILTWHDPTNCGSALQAYALHYYLRELGNDAKIIRYVPKWCRGDYMLMPWSAISGKRHIYLRLDRYVQSVIQRRLRKEE